MTWRATVLSLFPAMFPGPLGESLAGKALADGLWSLRAVDIREFARDKHRSVDDAPFGGGPGMVMRPDVLAAAIDSVLAEEARRGDGARPWYCLSPRGRRFDQAQARAFAGGPGLNLICGRFEGIDQRVLDARGIEELSLGDFVLSGGEVAALAILEAAVRQLPGVVGNDETLREESFVEDLLEYPHYTRPREWEGRAVPAVLLSGDHGAVEAWRRCQARTLTAARRRDLWDRFQQRPEARGRNDEPA